MREHGPDAWSNWSATQDDPSTSDGGAAAITYTEVLDWRRRGGYVRYVRVEAQPSEGAPLYAVFVLASWQPGYCALHVNYPSRPRTFRSVDRLLNLLRNDFHYQGSIEFCVAGYVKGRKPPALRKP